MPAGISLAVRAGGVAGALLLAVAELTPLYDEDSAASKIAVRTVQTGTHHAYALIPIAVFAIMLAFGAARTASRPAFLALGVLGILAMVIALVGDLPDAQAAGFARGTSGGLVNAKDVPEIGLYLETLGAVVLVITCGAGLLLSGSRGVSRSPRAEEDRPRRSAP